MHSKLITSGLSLLATGASLAAAEDVLGLYVFHRHGDRTAKAWKPVNLTALGSDQVHSSGEFYRQRYVAEDADRRIRGLSADEAALAQLSFTSSDDHVLHNSGVAFLQGLYPPTNEASETLADGTRVEAPLDGYQYVPVSAVDDAATADKAESNAWLQGGSGCTKGEASSNAYLSSQEYRDVYESSLEFYKDLLPVINGTFSEDDANFKKAYSIFDLINVASIHNSSIASSNLLTNVTMDRLYNLASVLEWNLAYNSSDPIRAIAGSILAGQIVEALEPLAEGKSSVPRFNAQFGAYGTFMAFFGLAGLPQASADFYGIVDYASSMAFELVTNATNPTADDVSVRFYFSNGTAAEDNEPKLFPLFGQQETTLSWARFKDGMNQFAVQDTEHWCDMCGNTDGQCASSASASSGKGGDCASKDDGDISKTVAGVIGALVTLVVILGSQAAIMLIGGLRLVRKPKATAVQVQMGEKA